MTNPNPGLQQRKCTTSIAGRGWSDHERRYLTRQLLVRWIRRGWKDGSKRKGIRNFLVCLQKQEPVEGWEYSSLIGWKFHRKERSTDTFRRCRWSRKMVPSDRIGPSAIFKLEGALVSLSKDPWETLYYQIWIATFLISESYPLIFLHLFVLARCHKIMIYFSPVLFSHSKMLALLKSPCCIFQSLVYSFF